VQDSCEPYIADSVECNSLAKCETCLSSGCYTPENYRSWKLDSYRKLDNYVSVMQDSIVNNGPIVC